MDNFVSDKCAYKPCILNRKVLGSYPPFHLKRNELKNKKIPSNGLEICYNWLGSPVN